MSERDLYAEAAEVGVEQAEKFGAFQVAEGGRLMDDDERVQYWTARHAARETAKALLAEAQRVGVTAEQWEALRVVAADVAYD